MKSFKFLTTFFLCFFPNSAFSEENSDSDQAEKIDELLSRWGSGGTTFVEIDPDLKPIPDHVENKISKLQMNGKSVIINNKDGKYDENKAFKFSLKYSLPITAVLFPDTSKKPEEMSESIQNMMERTIEPSTTVIHLDKMDDILENLHKLKLEDLPTLSKIILVHDNKAHIPCFASAYDDKAKALVPIPKGAGEKEVEKLWMDANSDFHKMSVKLKRDSPLFDQSFMEKYAKECGNVKSSWLNINIVGFESVDPYLLCLRFYLFANQNVAFSKEGKPTLGRFETWKTFPEELLGGDKKPRMAMITPGFSTLSYRFGIIMEKTEFKVTPFALFQPFDILTWMLILLSLFLSTIVLYALAYSKSHDVPFWETFFFNVCLLLDQADNDFVRRIFKTGFWKTIPYLAAWMFCSFVLKTLYQGALYSSLSVSTMPEYPKNIWELIKSDDFPVVFCHDDINPITEHIYQLRTSWDKTSEQINEKKKEFLIWLDGKNKRYEPYRYENDAIWIFDSALGFAEENELPKQFAVIGTQTNVEMFTSLTKLFYNNKKMEMKVDGELPLQQEKFVIASKNFLHSHLSKRYSRLHESGILGYLESWSDKVEPKLRVAKWIKEEREYEQLPDHINKLSYSMLMAPNKASQDKAELFPEEKPVSFESVKIPFTIYGLMLATAFAFLLLELIIFHLTNKLKDEERARKRRERERRERERIVLENLGEIPLQFLN